MADRTEHNVVAVYDQPGGASSAVKALESARIPESHLSYLGSAAASDDATEVGHAATILLQHAPVRLDQFDGGGNPPA